MSARFHPYLCGRNAAEWLIDMENSNMTGHWTGIFTAKGDETEIDFTEQVKAKKWLLKPFVKSYLKTADTVCCGYNEKFFVKTYT